MAVVPLLLKMFAQGVHDGIATQAKWKQGLIQFLRKINHFLTKIKPCYGISKLLLRPIHEKFGGTLRILFVGGGFVDPQTAEFFYTIGIPAVIGYGLTEACTVVTVNDLNQLRFDTVGKPVPGVQLDIRNTDNQGIGEIYVKGPTVMSAYYQADELTSTTLLDGWLRTGDLGKLESDGHLKLVGRCKNMIVTSGGKNVYPEDIESAFDSIDGCHEFAIFAKNYILQKHELIDEKLFIVLRLSPESDKKKLLSQVRSRNQSLVEHKRVSEFLIWMDEFPRTASLKLKRERLAESIRCHLSQTEYYSLSEL